MNCRLDAQKKCTAPRCEHAVMVSIPNPFPWLGGDAYQLMCNEGHEDPEETQG